MPPASCFVCQQYDGTIRWQECSAILDFAEVETLRDISGDSELVACRGLLLVDLSAGFHTVQVRLFATPLEQIGV
jgi:hypothetical protein